MESKIKTSFIPKKPIAQAAKATNAPYKSGGLDITMLISIVALVVAGVLSGGVFFYNTLAQSDADNKIEQLQKARGAFEPKLIQELMLLSDRIRVAEGILENHTAPSVFLHALEQDTLSGVQFIDFEYKQKSIDRAIFSLKGKTSSVNSVALQSSRFGESTIIKDPIFSDIDLVKDGVIFTVEGEIDLGAIRYSSVATVPMGSFNTNTSFEIGDLINGQNIDTQDFGDFGDFGIEQSAQQGAGQGRGAGNGMGNRQ